MGPDDLVAIQAQTDAMERVNLRVRISELERALSTVWNHWNEFGPEHGFAEVIDRAAEALFTDRKSTVRASGE